LKLLALQQVLAQLQGQALVQLPEQVQEQVRLLEQLPVLG
jgi:hypothetical protein